MKKCSPLSVCAKIASPGRKAAYSAAAAATVVAGDAQAVLVYSGIQDTSISQFSSLVVDLDGNSSTDVRLKNYVFGGNYQGAVITGGTVVGFTGTFAYATALGAGALIDATTTASGLNFVSMAYGNNPQSQFDSTPPGGSYLGFSFAGSSLYGWIRVSIDNAAGTFVVHDWAYTDSPDGILAGQTVAAIPEAATLGFFAAGAVGLTAMRRRRSQNDESAA